MYNEILRLEGMLKSAEIPYEMERFGDGWRICYPATDLDKRVASVFQTCTSLGGEHDLLELVGLTQPGDLVMYSNLVGHLIAEEVFGRILADYSTKIGAPQEIRIQVWVDDRWVDGIRTYGALEDAQRRLDRLDEVGIVARIKTATNG